jgi:hypothetical protein
MNQPSIRLPIILTREPGGWQARLADDTDPPAHPYQGHGTTRSTARADLIHVVLRALAASREPIALVIGGDPEHAGHIHTIRPTPYGWIVHRVHHGRSAIAWGSYDTREDAITAVLRHVGGNPALVNL